MNKSVVSIGVKISVCPLYMATNSIFEAQQNVNRAPVCIRRNDTTPDVLNDSPYITVGVLSGEIT